MWSACTVFQLLSLCMSLGSPRCSRMVKRLGKQDTSAYSNPVFAMSRVHCSMWTFLFLYNVYIVATMAQTSPPLACPTICECSGSIVKCVQKNLREIPVDLPEHVTELDLSKNNISTIPNNIFLKCPKLIKLNLNNNNVSDVLKLGKFPNSLGKLYLRANKIKLLSRDWGQVTFLDVSDNKITTIENSTFGENSILNELNLSNNEITTVNHRGLINLASLKILRLDGNRLTSLPNLLLKALTVLDLSNNLLETLPAFRLSAMAPSLQYLKLSKNQIRKFPTAPFFDLRIRKLYLDDNLLTNISEQWLYGLKHLEYLYLQNNKIVSITSNRWDSRVCCQNLKFVNLANNNLRRVLFEEGKNGYTGSFAALGSLVLLNLSSNGIYEISDHSFSSLKNLQVLDLSRNNLSWTSYDGNGTFKGLRKLKKLNLSKNEITSVVKTMFEEAPAVEKLDLTNNPIEEVGRNAFQPLRSLKDLRMNSQSLYCNCNLRWFSQWLASSTFARLVTLKCQQPKKLAGRDFSKVGPQEFACDASRLEITKHPQPQTALRGDDMQLSCTVRNGSITGIKIFWKKNNKDIDPKQSDVTTHTQVTDNIFHYYKSVLRLRNVTEARDGGSYQCVVVTPVGEWKSRNARVQVLVAPTFTTRPKDVITRLGGIARFNCSATGDPSPEISYNKADWTDRFPARDRLDLRGETLIFRHVTVEDAGMYRCFAKSDAGVINTTFHLHILGPPVPLRRMLNKVSLLHDSVIFVCAVTAWPVPKFVWLKDGIPVDLTSSNVRYRRLLNAEHLHIMRADKSDAGVYKCMASNSLGTTELTSRLDVVEDLSSRDSQSSSDNGGYTRKTLIVAVVFTASSTMVITTLVCVVIHAISRRGRGLCPTRRKDPGVATLDSYRQEIDCCNRQYVPIAENSPSQSPRSSTTFVTTSDSQTPSDSNFLQTSSSDSSSTKDNREGSFDGRHSSGVCSMNSSTSSLASSTTNHRNTFPFANNSQKNPYPVTTSCFYDAGDECCTIHHRPQGQSLLLVKYNDGHSPARRKQKCTSRSRDRHATNKRRKELDERVFISKETDDSVVGLSSEEYRTESDGTTL